MAKFTLHPANELGRFVRTIRVEDREPRFVVFLPGDPIDLDDAEQAYMAAEIAGGLIVPIGFTPVPKVKKPEPKRDPREDDPERVRCIPRDPLPSDRHGAESWARRTLKHFFSKS